jgi:hypothetical protein
MEAHLDQQESMFAEPAELESQEYAESFEEPEGISNAEPISEEESEILFAGGEQDTESYSAVAAKPLEDEAPAAVPEAPSAPESKVSVSDAGTKPSSELVPLSADDFSALEDRILRAVKLVQTEREARIAAEDCAAQLQSQLDTQSPLVEKLQTEIEMLRLEREQVRQRVERLLAQLDALEL